MDEERKITIIEGPTPVFEPVQQPMGELFWGILEGPPRRALLARTRVRALNGPALVERCHRAWRAKDAIYLEFRTPLGLVQRVPIAAVRYEPTDEGDVLTLWVLLPQEVLENLAEPNGDDSDDFTY
ncbi:MAG: hypothetical protein GXO54_05600 [Chloroflexi bacterium]|nr:hypothetical protein [Chloroflexota bacterium]